MSSSSSSTTGGARLVITKQESPEQEAIHKNGENKLLHSVIKNVPFVIDLGLEGDFDRSAINFNRCTLEATLLYDSREDKPVHYVSRRPVEYNCTVDKAAGDKVKVECTLNVLSSQHEGAHFRLRFTAASLALHVLSDPIRVVSKPLQLKKVKEQRKAAAAQAAASSALEGKTVTGKKRPLSDSIQDTLARIEAQQQAQQTLISSLFQTVMAQLPLTPATSVPNTPLATASPVSSPCSQATASPAAIFAQPATPPAKRRRLDPNTTPPSAPEPREDTFTFESHLRGLIESFHAIAPSHRAQAVHSAVTKATPMQVEKLSGLVDVFCAEGLGRTAHMISLSAAPLSAPFTTTTTSSSTRVPHHPWQLSSASSPLISAGADASDDDDDATASWLSTETSPMSPGDQSASSQASTSTFSFDSIEVMFPADGHVASSSSQKPTTMLGDWDHNDAEDEIYNELFSLLDQGEASPSF